MGTLQARIPEWVAMCSSRASSQPRDRTQGSRIAGRFFTAWATGEAQEHWSARPVLSPGDRPDPGIGPGSPASQADSLPASQADSLPAELASYTPLTVEDTDAQCAGYRRLPLQTFTLFHSALHPGRLLWMYCITGFPYSLVSGLIRPKGSTHRSKGRRKSK